MERESKGQSTEISPPVGRKPYHAPKLKRIGSVRDLTMGSAGKTPDGVSMPTRT